VSNTKQETRSIELEVRVNAPVETVWRAFAEPEQLANWFPLRASGSQGKGGKVTLSWGTTGDWTTTIDEWVPNEHIRWVDPPAAEGLPPTAIDFRLEADGGSTIVRLVHSGFSAAADWDEMYDATKGGWTYFLYNLQHYMEWHPDTPREMIWVRRPTTRTPDDVWKEILGSNGLGIDPEVNSIAPGQQYRFNALGEPVVGKVHLVNPPVQFAGTADSLEDGLLFVELEPGRERRHVGIWLSTYGLKAERVAGLRTSLESLADRIFGVETKKEEGTEKKAR
jgi:uncharacterized protein YndB with AHSA1/START domain